MVLLLLLSMAFYGVPILAAPETIKIGVFGPETWMQGKGMLEGAEIARDEINAGGGILGHPVEIVFADTLRGKLDPDAATGRAAAEELLAAEVDFVIGGFRTEAVLAAREVFMDNQKIYFIAGSSTDFLIDNGTATNPYGDVRVNYARYRYVFRQTPINSTTLFKSIAGFLKFAMASRLIPSYGAPLKIAVISEALMWADTIHFYLSWDYFWNTIMGMAAYGGVNVVYDARVSPVATDVSAELTGVKNSEARLLIEILSGPVGRAFITQWYDMGVKAVPLGINVLGQEIPTHWTVTGGKAQYEGFLAISGQRTPVTDRMVAFYDETMLRYGHAPIYTSYGVYDGIIAIDEVIEAAGRWPMTSDEMVPLFEQTDRPHGIGGRFKYTGPHPMTPGEYATYMANATHSYLDINPTMKGTLHDVFSNELGPEWREGYMRALFTQWQAGRLEVIYPIYETAPIRLPYSKIFLLPRYVLDTQPMMYPYPSDVVTIPPISVGDIDIFDALTVRGSFGTVPGDPAWEYAADVNDNWEIELFDALAVRADFPYRIALPLPYCSEADRLIPD